MLLLQISLFSLIKGEFNIIIWNLKFYCFFIINIQVYCENKYQKENKNSLALQVRDPSRKQTACSWVYLTDDGLTMRPSTGVWEAWREPERDSKEPKV